MPFGGTARVKPRFQPPPQSTLHAFWPQMRLHLFEAAQEQDTAFSPPSENNCQPLSDAFVRINSVIIIPPVPLRMFVSSTNGNGVCADWCFLPVLSRPTE